MRDIFRGSIDGMSGAFEEPRNGHFKLAVIHNEINSPQSRKERKVFDCFR